MKMTLLAALMLAASPLLPAEGLAYPGVEAARQTAQKENKPALIIWHGSDWLPGGEALCREWSRLAGADLPVVLGQFDEKTGLGHQVRAKLMPVEIYNLPVALLLAPDGTLMAIYDGKTVRSAERLSKAVKRSLRALPQFTELLEQGRRTEGVEGARLLGRALDLLDKDDAVRCKPVVEQIRKKDPEDASGYLAAYAMGHMDMYGQINKRLNGADGKLKGAARDFDAAEAYVKGVLARKSLSRMRRQQWTAGLAYIERERMLAQNKIQDRAARKALTATLRSIVKMDPKSEYGKGAAFYADYWDPDTFITVDSGFYDSCHQTHNFEKDWHVRVTDQVTKPGLYRFTLVPRNNGRMVTRNYRLAINGKVVGQASIPPEQNTKSVELRVPRAGKGSRIEVWLTAECRDGWLGCSGEVKMERIGD